MCRVVALPIKRWFSCVHETSLDGIFAHPYTCLIKNAELPEPPSVTSCQRRPDPHAPHLTPDYFFTVTRGQRITGFALRHKIHLPGSMITSSRRKFGNLFGRAGGYFSCGKCPATIGRNKHCCNGSTRARFVVLTKVRVERNRLLNPPIAKATAAGLGAPCVTTADFGLK